MKEIKITGYLIKQILTWVGIGIPSAFMIYSGISALSFLSEDPTTVWEYWCIISLVVCILVSIVVIVILIAIGIMNLIEFVDDLIDDDKEFTIKRGKKK